MSEYLTARSGNFCRWVGLLRSSGCSGYPSWRRPADSPGFLTVECKTAEPSFAFKQSQRNFICVTSVSSASLR